MISLLLLIILSSGGPVVMGSLLHTLGNLLVPSMCDLVNENVIPTLLQGVFNLVAHGSNCTPSCIKADDSQDNHYHFQIACDITSLEDHHKVGYCEKKLAIVADVVGLLGCTADCTTTVNGASSIFGPCPRPFIELSLGSLL